MEGETTNPMSSLRSVKRSDLKDVRNKHKEFILCHKRLRLNEVTEYIQDVSLSEFKTLLLKLKQRPVPLELLKKIKNLCISPEYIEALFKNEGAFQAILRILIGSDAQKQLEAAACFTNLACGSHKCSYKIAKAAGVYLISFVNGSSYFLQDQSIWALANIANDCLDCFNIIKSQGVLPALLKAFMTPVLNVQSLVFALNACTKYEDPEIISLIQKDFPKHLLTFLEQDNVNEHVFLDTASTISNCCFLSIKYSLNILDDKSIERIVKVLLKTLQEPGVNILIATALVRSIGFLTCDDQVCKFLVSLDDFYKSNEIIASAYGCVQLIKEALWMLSNVAVSVDTKWNISIMLLFIDIVKKILKQEKSLTLQVLFYLSILVLKDKSAYLKLTQHEIFDEIQSLLECKDSDISAAARVFLEIGKF